MLLKETNVQLNKYSFYKCYDSISIGLSRGMVYDSYCCRSWYDEKYRKSIQYLTENTKEYLDNLFSDFIVSKKYPEGYCIKSEKNNICNLRVKKSDIHCINLGTLTYCNYNCKYCSQKSNTNSGMSLIDELELTRKLINEFSNYKNINRIQLSNAGELTIYDIDNLFLDLPDNIKHINILSNGSNLEKLLKIKQIIELQKKEVSFNISIPTFNKFIYKNLTNKDNSEYIYNRLDLLKELHATVNLILFKENINDIDNFINIIKIQNKIPIFVLANMYDDDMKKEIFNISKRYTQLKYEFQI